MGTRHKIIFGSSRDMSELGDDSVHLAVTSPPYFNAPFDYPDLFEDYRDFKNLIQDVANELYRVIANGRICCIVVDDMLVDGVKYPVVSDITSQMLKSGFRYRDKIIWIKPKGYVRISKRSGVLLQHPYPMYFYPDNLQESILIFQKGRFDYSYLNTLPKKTLAASRIDTKEFNDSYTSLTVWDGFPGEERTTFPDTWRITNVLPTKGRVEEGVAAFPEEIPRRLIKLFTFVGENVLDPFTGSGTTLKVAKDLGRNSIGYEIDLELKSAISRRLECNKAGHPRDRVEFIERVDAGHYRTILQRKVKGKEHALQR